MARLHRTILLCTLVGSTLGSLYTDPGQLNSTTYDFIVVGAGTAGNVIAARLTENPSIRVLVVEAGVSDTGFRSQDLQIPLFAPRCPINSPFDWNYTTTPQKGLNNQIITYARGYVLGGSSATNLLTWTRGSRDDYDRFSEVIGDNSYSWNNMIKYFKKSEQWIHPRDGRDDSDEYNPAVHGTNGPILLSTGGVRTVMDTRVLATTEQLSEEFPFNLDANSGDILGVGWLQSTMGGGSRSSSSTAYLRPALSSRKNIDVLIQTQATKLIKTGSSNGVPQFRSLEVGRTTSSKRFTFTARKEIVLSAGAVGSPQILMLSGIGDPAELSKVGIKSTLSLPDVGKNLIDHPIVGAQYILPNDTTTIDPITLGEDPASLANALTQWTANKTGTLSSAGGNFIGFFRVPDNSTILKDGDPAAGPGSSHYELAWQAGFASSSQPPPTSGRYISNIHVVTTPTSRGSISLNSSNPFTSPIIDPNFFDTDYDLSVMVYAIRSAQRFIKAQPWNGFILAPYPDLAPIFADNSTDADIITYIRKFARTIHHPVGTAAASKEKGKGVVDANLLVKNASGIRVVDASVLPFLPSVHPLAGIYGIAELAADKIKNAYGI